MSVVINQVRKRDGQMVPFHQDRIMNALSKAMHASNEGSPEEAKRVTEKVVNELHDIKTRHKNFVPNVEGIQDTVEKVLILSGYVQTAKNYILYRERHAQIRQKALQVPENLRKLANESKSYFRNILSEFVYLRTYARWSDAENRRETWVETVDRYVAFMKENLGDKLSPQEYAEIRMSILKQEIMPSMRLLQFAGKAARVTHVCGYNCSYIAPSKIEDLGEIMYISMCGTGVGFSVESQNVQALPQIQMQVGEMLKTHIVEDSKEGWCDAFVLGLNTWYSGKDIQFDFSKLRPAGARLKTFGGRSSGPEPLRSLLDFSRNKILSRQGRRLTNINVHDIICKIGEVVVSGGVRRSAMISLSDLDDQAMRDAKKGQFYYTEPQRSIANNSAVYSEKPSNEVFLEEWLALMKSGSGERGIFNRGSLSKTLPKRRLAVFKERGLMTQDNITGSVGTNPCGEIILQSKQFCNLSEVVARAEDTEEDLLRKIRLATIVGTYQSTLTNFKYLSEDWQKNCERERLLGVSITGQWDCERVRHPDVLQKLKEHAILMNQEYAKRFNINASTCITCVKPSGTVSQTVDCASGMHPRHAPYYIRRIRISASDALFKMLKKQGVPYYPEVGQSEMEATTFVLEFPVKAPTGAVCRDDLTAIDQLEHWKMVKRQFTEHNPSVTISVGEHEWINVANWVYLNWDIVGGLSFLPRFEHVYQLAPYETISEERYNQMVEKMTGIDFAQIIAYEHSDETELKKELACAGGACEIL